MKIRILAVVALLFVGLTTLFVACSSTPPANTPGSAGPTPTYTFTQICNVGLSPTCTPIGTACANTPVPTATVALTDYASGTASYTGSLGTVSTAHAIYVLASGSPTFSGGNFILDHVNANGGTYRINTPGPGTGYFLAMFDLAGYGNYSAFPVGSPYYINGGGSGGCAAPGTGTVISGATAGPNFSFGDTCRIPGIYGTATYIGNRGLVGICRQIHFLAYSDAGYTTLTGDNTNISTNGGRYDLNTFIGGATTPVYLGAYFDVNGNGTNDTGDSYIQMGLITPSYAGTHVNITFSDAFIIP